MRLALCPLCRAREERDRRLDGRHELRCRLLVDSSRLAIRVDDIGVVG